MISVSGRKRIGFGSSLASGTVAAGGGGAPALEATALVRVAKGLDAKEDTAPDATGTTAPDIAEAATLDAALRGTAAAALDAADAGAAVDTSEKRKAATRGRRMRVIALR